MKTPLSSVFHPPLLQTLHPFLLSSLLDQHLLIPPFFDLLLWVSFVFLFSQLSFSPFFFLFVFPFDLTLSHTERDPPLILSVRKPQRKKIKVCVLDDQQITHIPTFSLIHLHCFHLVQTLDPLFSCFSFSMSFMISPCGRVSQRAVDVAVFWGRHSPQKKGAP